MNKNDCEIEDCKKAIIDAVSKCNDQDFLHSILSLIYYQSENENMS